MPRFPAVPFVFVLGALPMLPVWAQQQPDAGSLTREAERHAPSLPARAAPPIGPAAAAVPAAPGLAVRVESFALTGVTLLPESELQAMLTPFKNRSLSFKELQQAADAVAAAYRARGYLVRAGLPAQDLSSGRLTIAVVEGRLSELRVDTVGEAATRLREGTVRRFLLARQQLGEPLQADDLQRGISLLNDQPGVTADLLLEPGQREGDSAAVVRVRDRALVSGSLQLDNTGVRSTGSERALASVSLDDPLGLGDQLGVNALKTSNSSYGRLAYGLPLGGDGLRASAALSELRYDYGASGTRFAGTADIGSLTLSYPLRCGNDWNLNLAATADAKRFHNSIAGVEINNKQADVATLSLSGDRSDLLGGGGVWLGGLAWLNGRLDLSPNAADFSTDQAGARRAGSFDKWQWNLARLQQFSAGNTGWLALSGQVASKNLDSAEKMGLGGPSGVRAYPSGEASGDDGWLLSAEWRHQLDEAVQLSGFYDRGGVTRDHLSYAGTMHPNTVVLSGVGLGVRWMASHGVALNASVAWRIGENPLRDAAGLDSDGTRRDPRVWLSISKSL